nr:hypothetical protein [uncultured Oscillibacter sp.]
MKKGLGIVTCGNCRRTMVVAWPGYKYKVNCPTCGKIMNIHRQRLKKFEELKG